MDRQGRLMSGPFETRSHPSDIRPLPTSPLLQSLDKSTFPRSEISTHQGPASLQNISMLTIRNLPFDAVPDPEKLLTFLEHHSGVHVSLLLHPCEGYDEALVRFSDPAGAASLLTTNAHSRLVWDFRYELEISPVPCASPAYDFDPLNARFKAYIDTTSLLNITLPLTRPPRSTSSESSNSTISQPNKFTPELLCHFLREAIGIHASIKQTLTTPRLVSNVPIGPRDGAQYSSSKIQLILDGSFIQIVAARTLLYELLESAKSTASSPTSAGTITNGSGTAANQRSPRTSRRRILFRTSMLTNVKLLCSSAPEARAQGQGHAHAALDRPTSTHSSRSGAEVLSRLSHLALDLPTASANAHSREAEKMVGAGASHDSSLESAAAAYNNTGSSSSGANHSLEQRLAAALSGAGSRSGSGIGGGIGTIGKADALSGLAAATTFPLKPDAASKLPQQLSNLSGPGAGPGPQGERARGASIAVATTSSSELPAPTGFPPISIVPGLPSMANQGLHSSSNSIVSTSSISIPSNLSQLAGSRSSSSDAQTNAHGKLEADIESKLSGGAGSKKTETNAGRTSQNANAAGLFSPPSVPMTQGQGQGQSNARRPQPQHNETDHNVQAAHEMINAELVEWKDAEQSEKDNELRLQLTDTATIFLDTFCRSELGLFEGGVLAGGEVFFSELPRSETHSDLTGPPGPPQYLCHINSPKLTRAEIRAKWNEFYLPLARQLRYGTIALDIALFEGPEGQKHLDRARQICDSVAAGAQQTPTNTAAPPLQELAIIRVTKEEVAFVSKADLYKKVREKLKIKLRPFRLHLESEASEAENKRARLTQSSPTQANAGIRDGKRQGATGTSGLNVNENVSATRHNPMQTSSVTNSPQKVRGFDAPMSASLHVGLSELEQAKKAASGAGAAAGHSAKLDIDDYKPTATIGARRPAGDTEHRAFLNSFFPSSLTGSSTLGTAGISSASGASASIHATKTDPYSSSAAAGGKGASYEVDMKPLPAVSRAGAGLEEAQPYTLYNYTGSKGREKDITSALGTGKPGARGKEVPDTHDLMSIVTATHTTPSPYASILPQRGTIGTGTGALTNTGNAGLSARLGDAGAGVSASGRSRSPDYLSPYYSLDIYGSSLLSTTGYNLYGAQPEDGTLQYVIHKDLDVPGFAGAGCVVLNYHFADGSFLSGVSLRKYRGGQFTAYLPANDQGLRLLELFRKAFDRRITFRIVPDLSGFRNNTTATSAARSSPATEWAVAWNPLMPDHKTDLFQEDGQERFGYPDDFYLDAAESRLKLVLSK